jgi:DNA-binding Lrp family transcriptional regulator
MGDLVVDELDWKDKKILRELDCNARQSFASIAKKTGLSKQVVVYRINNMMRSGLIKQLISFIDVQRLGYTFYDVFFKLKHYTKEKEHRVIKEISKLPEVGWFVSTRGEWKLIVCIMAKDPAEFNRTLERLLRILGHYVIRYDFFLVLDAYQLPYKNVLDARKEAYPMPTHLGTQEEVVLNDHDKKVIAKLANDARIPKNILAEETGLTLEMVRHSMKKLEKSGLIQAYKPRLDVTKAGYSWHIMLVQFNPSTEKEKDEFMSFLKNRREVSYLVKGVGNWSLMIDFHAKTLEEFGEVHELINARFEHLISNEAVLQIIKEHKCTFLPEI